MISNLTELKFFETLQNKHFEGFLYLEYVKVITYSRLIKKGLNPSNLE